MGGLGREGGGARVSDFFTQNPYLKKKKWGEGDGMGWIDGRTDEQVQTDCPFN